MDIGTALRSGREARKLTQTELGQLAGLTRQTVADVERNKGRIVSLDILQQHVPVSISGLPAGRHLGERMKLARTRRQLTLRDAAQRAEIAVNTIKEIEDGRGTLGPLRRLARVVAPRAKAKPIKDAANRRGLAVVGWVADRVRHRADHYPSPAPIVRLLLDAEEFDRDQPILEPAVGEARVIERVLKERGYTPVCFDLHGEGSERRDFFDITEPYQSIITNPPFRLHRQFVQHAKRIAAHKFAFLLPLNYVTGAGRHREIWTDSNFPLARVHVLVRGIDFISSNPMSDSFKSSQVYCCWCVWQRDHEGPPTMHWLDNHQHVERKSSRKRALLESVD